MLHIKALAGMWRQSSAAPSESFTFEEVKALHAEFSRHSGGDSPAQWGSHDCGGRSLRPHGASAVTGLAPVQWLQMFDLSDALTFCFAERFVGLFWRERRHLANAKINLRDFLHVYAAWTRGSLEDKLTLLFRLYDNDAKGYVVAEDIMDFQRSIFHFFHKRGCYDWTSKTFQATVALSRITDDELARRTEEVIQKRATAAIKAYHRGADGKKLLWFDEFQRWIVAQPGVVDMLCKHPAHPSATTAFWPSESLENDMNSKTHGHT